MISAKNACSWPLESRVPRTAIVGIKGRFREAQTELLLLRRIRSTRLKFHVSNPHAYTLKPASNGLDLENYPQSVS